MKKNLISILLIVPLLSTLALAGTDQFIPLDPSLCDDKESGYTYFKFGNELFRYLQDSPFYVTANLSASPKSTTSSEPLGCYSNPYIRPPVRYRLRNGEDIIENVELKSFGFVQVNQKYYATVKNAEKNIGNFFDLIKIKFGLCVVIDNILEQCRIPPNDKSKPLNKQSLSYKAQKNLYLTPMGRPFAIECRSYLDRQDCVVYYRMFESVDVSYKFYHDKIAPENLVNFDKYLRKIVNNMHVAK